MREIKLRAYSKEYNFMCPPGFTMDSLGRVLTDKGYTRDSHILMFYTGLKDSTNWDELSDFERKRWLGSGKTEEEWVGKEIYEKDIVEYENGNAGYGRPRHEEISRDVIPSIFEHDEYVDNIMWWLQGRVIGNILENPELVEGMEGK